MKEKTLLKNLAAGTLGLALLMSIGLTSSKLLNAEAATPEVIATAKTDDIVTNSGYKDYTNDSWVVTFGGNNKSGGTNSNNRSKCNLSSYSKYADGTNVTTSKTAFAVANLTPLSNVEKITFSYTGGSNNSRGTAYLNVSDDNATFVPATLIEGTQGMEVESTDTTYTFSFDVSSSTYFALIIIDTGTTGNFRFDSLTVNYYASPYEPNVTELVLNGDMDNKTYGIGESWNPSGLTVVGNPEGVDITNSVTWSYSPATPSLGVTEVEVTATYKEISISKTITGIEVRNVIIDSLISSDFSATTNTYVETINVEKESHAMYTANSAKNSDGDIQLRTTNSNSGIVTTKSGGVLKSIEIVWGTGNANGRTVDVYVSNTPYSTPANLYSSSTQGELIGSIVYGESTSVSITGNYSYIGLRSNSGALYIKSISIKWLPLDRTINNIVLEGTLEKTSYFSNEQWDSTGLALTINYSDMTSETVTTGFDLLWNPETPAVGVTSVEVMASYQDSYNTDVRTFNVSVTEYTAPAYTFAPLENPAGTSFTLEGLDWTYYLGAGKISVFDSNKGLHFGKTGGACTSVNLFSEPFKAINANNETNINRIIVEASSASSNSGNVALNVKVNNEIIGQRTLTSTNTAYDFVLAEPKIGHIEIEMIDGSPESSKAAMYLKSIQVFADYDETNSTVIDATQALNDIRSCEVTSASDNFLELFVNYDDFITTNETTFANLVLYDYANGDTTYAGNRVNKVDFMTKYNYCVNRYNESSANPATMLSITTNTTTAILIILFSTLPVMAVVAYFAFGKRRQIEK